MSSTQCCLDSCFLPVGHFLTSSSLPFHSHSRAYYCKLVMRQARWLGGAPTWGSSVVFITSASSESMVSKRLFLFPLGFPPPIPILLPSCFGYGAKQGRLPGAHAAQAWNPQLKKASKPVSEAGTGLCYLIANIPP